MSQKKKDLAIKVADEALAKAPDNLALQILRKQVDGDEKAAAELTRKAIEGIKDPFRREKNLYEFYMMQNDSVEAAKHLDAAEKINPEDEGIMDLRFNTALMERKWDIAEKYATKLGIKNKDEA